MTTCRDLLVLKKLRNCLFYIRKLANMIKLMFIFLMISFSVFWRTRLFSCAALTAQTSTRRPTLWWACVNTVRLRRSPTRLKGLITKSATSAVTVKSPSATLVLDFENLLIHTRLSLKQDVSCSLGTIWVKTGANTVTPAPTVTACQRNWWRLSTEARLRSSAQRTAGRNTPCSSAM